MLDFDELQELEQARADEDKEEQRQSQAESWAETMLRFEETATRRLERQEDEPIEGMQGALIVVNSVDPKTRSSSSIFFCDVIKKSRDTIKKSISSDVAAASACVKLFSRHIDAISAFFQALVHLHFQAGASECCEKIAQVFLNISVALDHWIERLSSSPRREAVYKGLRTLLAHLRRLWALRLATSPDTDDWVADLFSGIVGLVSPDLPQPLRGRWIEQGSCLCVHDEITLVIRAEYSGEGRSLVVNKSWTLKDLNLHLREVCKVEADITFHKQADKPSLPDFLSVDSLTGDILVRGIDTLPSSPEPCLQANGTTNPLEKWIDEWQAWCSGKIVKCTRLTVTRLLYELREGFANDKFQKRYKDLKAKSSPGNGAHTALLALTYSVQCEVLPKYGFAPTSPGVVEMRAESGLYAGVSIWEIDATTRDTAVWKLRRDIHACLDMGQSLPRLSASNSINSWFMWAQLTACVDKACIQAAEWIAQSDVLLLLTGAGFSADSGLAIYADVAKVKAYADREMTYRDLCDLQCLKRDPDLFWGFWGQCYNDYHDTPPHTGYNILSTWVDKRFRNSDVAKALQSRLRNDVTYADLELGEPYVTEGYAGAFFAFTSNVDAHHFDWFRACELRECHGNIELFQCASDAVPCPGVWRAPLSHAFHVDKDTMLAPKFKPAHQGSLRSDSQVSHMQKEESATPCVGRVRGGGRPLLLRHMVKRPPDTTTASWEAAFWHNHPTCPFCHSAARPAVLMFDDVRFNDLGPQSFRWTNWLSTVKAEARARSTSDRPLKIALLEVGAGDNVTTVRRTAERELSSFLDAGATVRLVRINPELPLGDTDCLLPGGDLHDLVVSILGSGLESIRRINAAMPPHMRLDS